MLSDAVSAPMQRLADEPPLDETCSRASPGTPASVMPREVLSADEAAEFLGVSKWALYDACARAEIPHRRIGRRIVFSRRALMVWLSCASPRSAGSQSGGNHAGVP
jgi:excisionase family DNA binding protein